MPYMKVSLSKALTLEEKQTLSNRLGEALSTIPGKESYMLIADIEDNKTIFCGGKLTDNFAFVDARYFSKFEYHVKQKFVKSVIKAIEDVVGTPEECISMTVLEFTTWGGFGDFADEYYSEK